MRVRVEPFEDIEVEVTPQSLGCAYTNGASPDQLPVLEALWAAMEEKWAELRVISLRHALGGYVAEDVGPESFDRKEGSEDHQELCTLAKSYLRSTGQPTDDRLDDIRYGGGVADVANRDHSLFVECGTLSGGYFSRITDGLSHHQTVMLIPYGLGCKTSRETLDRLLIPGTSVTKVAKKLRKNGRADLGYVFRPQTTFPKVQWTEMLKAAKSFHLAQWDPIVALAVRRAGRRFRERYEALLGTMGRAQSLFSTERLAHEDGYRQGIPVGPLGPEDHE